MVPLVACFFEEMVRRLRTPGACGIIGKIAGGKGLPNIKDRVHNPPGGVHAVVAMEKSRITYRAIIEEGFVACCGSVFAEIGVTEL